MAQYQLSEIKRSILFQCLINITVARVLYCLCFFNSRNVIYGGYVNMDITNYIEQNGAMQQVQHPLTNANENSNAHPVTLSPGLLLGQNLKKIKSLLINTLFFNLTLKILNEQLQSFQILTTFLGSELT